MRFSPISRTTCRTWNFPMLSRSDLPCSCVAAIGWPGAICAQTSGNTYDELLIRTQPHATPITTQQNLLIQKIWSLIPPLCATKNETNQSWANQHSSAFKQRFQMLSILKSEMHGHRFVAEAVEPFLGTLSCGWPVLLILKTCRCWPTLISKSYGTKLWVWGSLCWSEHRPSSRDKEKRDSLLLVWPRIKEVDHA